MADGERLSLQKALKDGRLDEFVAQAETDGVGATTGAEFDDAVRRLVKSPRSKGRTSHSASPDGSLGK